jgi:serine/threonine protein kinase
LRLRFKNEAALMANLNHPNIVTLHDYIETPQGVYLIMEYVEGITLDHYIRNVLGVIPEEKAIAIFKQILEGVMYAHSKGIVHRDLKPANIMLTAEGGVKILDFGIAKNLYASERALTQAGMKIGTIYYMSPEQVLAKELDRRSDIYSLGVMLFEMLTGQNPYQKLESEYAISHKIVHEPLPNLREIYPNIHPYWQKVIQKATQKATGARFQHVGELMEALHVTLEPVVPNYLKNPHREESSEDNTVEWKIRKSASPEAKTEISFAQNSAIAEALREPAIKQEPEVLLFENEFGKITNKKLTYLKGRDYFEKGKEETIALNKISQIHFQTRQELASGIFFMILLIGAFIGVFWSGWAWLIALPLLPITSICFTEFPAIIIQKQDGKKTVMRGWFWHTEKAREFAEVLKKELK